MRRIKETPYREKTRAHLDKRIPDDLIRFSFKYIDFSDKYPLQSKDDGYFKSFFERLRSLSRMKVDEFRTNKDKSLRAHTHIWSQNSEPEGFNHLNDQLRQCEPWQFQLSSNKHGRVHGILLDEVFYIIWLDPKHCIQGNK
jgi:hypothetical protein